MIFVKVGNEMRCSASFKASAQSSVVEVSPGTVFVRLGPAVTGDDRSWGLDGTGVCRRVPVLMNGRIVLLRERFTAVEENDCFAQIE